MKRKLALLSLFVPFGFTLLGIGLLSTNQILNIVGYIIIFIGSLAFGSFLRLKK